MVALALRLWGITFGLPYLEHPDEPFWIFAVLKMVKTGDPNPHDFIYPSLYYYLNALIYLVIYGRQARRSIPQPVRPAGTDAADRRIGQALAALAGPRGPAAVGASRAAARSH